MGRLIDLTGQRFGRLTVLERAGSSTDGHAKWLCRCDCGKTVVVRSEGLKSGKTQSCGCLKKERIFEANKKYNIFRVSDNIVYVKLLNSNHEMIVDKDAWFSEASKYCWDFHKHGYAYSSDKDGKTIRFHVWAFPDCPKGLVRDHINGNKLDNRRSNIRFITAKQNSLNHGKSMRNTSGYTGVRWDKDRRKWIAGIKVDGIQINLGRFLNLEDAITARKQAEIKYFGEYRRKEQPETD